MAFKITVRDATTRKVRSDIMNFLQEAGLQSKKYNNHAFVAEELGKAIVVGDYEPGSILPLDADLTEMFAVSRTVVREAKKTLGAKGLIQSKAKVGTRVCPKSQWNMFDSDVLRWHIAVPTNSEFIRELFEIRAIFEPTAAGMAAKMATKKDGQYLREIFDNFADSTHSQVAFAAADLELHKEILRISGNSFLVSLADLVQASLFGVFIQTSPDHDLDRMQIILKRHKMIVDAIQSGDQKRATKAMALVIKDGADSLNL